MSRALRLFLAAFLVVTASFAGAGAAGATTAPQLTAVVLLAGGGGEFSPATCSGLFRLFVIPGSSVDGTIINPGPVSTWAADAWSVPLADGDNPFTVIGTGAPNGSWVGGS